MSFLEWIRQKFVRERDEPTMWCATLQMQASADAMAEQERDDSERLTDSGE